MMPQAENDVFGVEDLLRKDKKFREITELLEKLSFYVELDMLIDP